MAFLSSLRGEATLLDAFKAFPATALPLLEYHEALMRGASPLSVAERELIAAFVSGLNSCHYCHGVHSVVARQFGIPEDLLQNLLQDIETAEMDPRLRPLMRFVKKLTLTPSHMHEADAAEVFAAGWSEQALHDAVSVCALFNFMNRFVEGLGIKVNPNYSEFSGKRLVSDGYLSLARLISSENSVASSAKISTQNL